MRPALGAPGARPVRVALRVGGPRWRSRGSARSPGARGPFGPGPALRLRPAPSRPVPPRPAVAVPTASCRRVQRLAAPFPGGSGKRRRLVAVPAHGCRAGAPCPFPPGPRGPSPRRGWAAASPPPGPLPPMGLGVAGGPGVLRVLGRRRPPRPQRGAEPPYGSARPRGTCLGWALQPLGFAFLPRPRLRPPQPPPVRSPPRSVRRRQRLPLGRARRCPGQRGRGGSAAAAGGGALQRAAESKRQRVARETVLAPRYCTTGSVQPVW